MPSDQHPLIVKTLMCIGNYSISFVGADYKKKMQALGTSCKCITSNKLRHLKTRCWSCQTMRYSAHVRHYLIWFKHSQASKECNLIALLHLFVHTRWVLSGDRLLHNGSVVALLLMPPECPQWQRRFTERTQRTCWSKERFICEFCCCVECQRHVMTEIWCWETDSKVSDDRAVQHKRE